jgi:hypothetical protein
MPESDSLLGINDIEGVELPDYRPFCVTAGVGLVLGILSFLAFLHPVMWFWPLVALLVNAYALFLLSRSDRLAGRNAAVWGLFLAILFGVAAPSRLGVYYWMALRDARDFGRQWLEAVLEGNVYKAHQMSSMPNDRKPLDDTLIPLYEQSSDLRTHLDTYLKTPVIATLRSLGSRALVRHYQTERVNSDGRNDLVEDVYAVTFDDEQGRKKSFFVKLFLWRNLNKTAGPRYWRVQNPEGGYTPNGWSP